MAQLLTDGDSSSTSENLDTILMAFTETFEQFVGQIGVVWPECEKVKEYCALFGSWFSRDLTEEVRKGAAKQLIQQWHQEFQTYYSNVTHEQEELFAEAIPFFRTIEFQNKWTDDLHPDTQAAIWEYLKNLCNLSNMYSIYTQVPDNLMFTIQQKAMRLAENISQGEIGLHNLNVEQLASEILTDVNMEDLQNFALSITNGGQDIGRIQDMCGSLMSMMGNQMDISSLFPAGK